MTVVLMLLFNYEFFAVSNNQSFRIVVDATTLEVIDIGVRGER
jgi:uncharacterized membrane protein YkoI